MLVAEGAMSQQPGIWSLQEFPHSLLPLHGTSFCGFGGIVCQIRASSPVAIASHGFTSWLRLTLSSMLSHRPCNLASVLIWLNFAPEFLGSGSASALRCVTFSKDSTGAEPLQLSWQRILRGLRLSHSDAASRPGMGLVSPSCCASRIALPSSRSFRLLCENAKKTNTLLPTSSCDVLRSVAGDPQPGSIDSSCPCRRIRADHDAAAYGGFRKRNRGSSSSLTRRRRPPKLATAHFSAWGRGTRPRCLRLV